MNVLEKERLEIISKLEHENKERIKNEKTSIRKIKKRKRKNS